MKLRSAILGMASVAALTAFSATAAMADMSNFAGTLTGTYANIDSTGSADLWAVDGSGVFGLTDHLKGQLDLGYTTVDGGGSVDTWNVGGNLAWGLEQGRIGAALGYNSTDTGFGTVHVTTYGGFGEWWASDNITVGVNGGGIAVSNGGPDGSYFGGGITGYVMPNVALNGSIDYITLNSTVDATDYTASVEYLFSEETPISISGGYTYTDVSSFGSTGIDTWFVKLRLYTNGDGAKTLKDRQRNGTLGTAAGQDSLLLKLL